MERYSIKEVAKQFNITTNKLRFYENKGLVKPYRDTENNYRYYTVEDVSKIQTILLYRSLNLTIDDIGKLLENYSYEQIMGHLYNLLEGINKQVHYYTSMRNIVQNALDDNKGEAQLLENLNKAVQVLNDQREVTENWTDKWNFDSWADDYDQSVRNAEYSNMGSLDVHGSYDDLLDMMEKEVMKTLDQSDVILDIGVGTGNLIGRFKEHTKRLIGVDASKNMLKVAKEKHPSASLRIGDFLNLPVESSSVDYVISSYAFHHLNKEEKGFALDEMFRVLKSDGEIIIGDLMFEDHEHKAFCYETFTDKQIEEIEDEFYSYVEWFKDEAFKRGYKAEFSRLDEITYMLIIKIGW